MQFLDLFPGNGDIAQRIAVERDLAADLVNQLAVQRVTIAQHQHIGSGSICGLGLARGTQHQAECGRHQQAGAVGDRANECFHLKNSHGGRLPFLMIMGSSDPVGSKSLLKIPIVDVNGTGCIA